MTRAAGRRILLLASLAVAAVLPLQAAAQLLAGPSAGGETIEPFLVALDLLAMISAAVGVTILWRRPGNLVGTLLLAGALLLTSVAAAWWWLTAIGLSSSTPLAVALTWWAIVMILPAVFVLFPGVGIVFPDGRLPGPRWRVPFAAIAACLIGGLVLQTVAPPAAGDVFRSPVAIAAVPAVVGDVGNALSIGAVLAAFVLAVGSVVVRYRRSAGVERAQVKWLVAAVLVNSFFFPVSYLGEVGPEGLLDVASVLVGCLVPIAVGVAVLRYRLYDIDRLISRTVSWTIVTGGIVAVFALLVVGLQAALDGVTQGETLAVALSTIVAAALFQPARRRVQQAVDRRFDRARYDADRTAAAFADRLRDDVDLDALTADLRATVGRAVRPATTTVWLVDRSLR